jgi:hypothetical protein
MRHTVSHEDLQPPQHDRIREHSSDSANQRIDRERETRGAIDDALRSSEARRARLRELDEEWDIDRALMLNFGVVGAYSALRAMSQLRRGHIGGWTLFFWVQLGFLVNHAVRGWCPPMPLFRRLGFRSAKEIAAERVALHQATDGSD